MERRRELKDVGHLGKTLRNAGLIQGEMQAGALNRDYKRLAEELGENGRLRARGHVLQHLKEGMVASKSEVERNTNMLLHKLSTEKLMTLKSEEDHRFKKAVREELTEHGYELLAHAEQGKRPSGIARIAKKFASTSSQSIVLRRYHEERRPLEKLLMRSKEFVDSEAEKLREINRDIADTKLMIYPPAKPSPLPDEFDQQLRDLGERVVDDTINVACRDIVRYERVVEDLKGKSSSLLSRSDPRQRQLLSHCEKPAATEYSASLLMAGNTLLESILRGLFAEAFSELKQENEEIGKLVREMFCCAILEGRKVKSTHQHLLSIFEQLRGARDTVKPFELFDLQRINEFVPMESKDHDVEAARIDVRLECISLIEPRELRDVEAQYWNCYNLVAQGYD